MRPDDSKFTTIPVGKLGIIAMESCSELGKKVDEYLVKWHKERQASDHAMINETVQDSFLLDASCPRFGSGEAKAFLRICTRRRPLHSCRRIKS